MKGEMRFSSLRFDQLILVHVFKNCDFGPRNSKMWNISSLTTCLDIL